MKKEQISAGCGCAIAGTMGLLVLGGLVKCTTTTVIPEGERGVRLTLGAIDHEKPLEPGIVREILTIDNVITYPVRTLEFEISNECYTQDKQKVKYKGLAYYHLDADYIVDFHKKYGSMNNVVFNLICPTLDRVIKDNLNQTNVDDLIEVREKASERIQETLIKELEKEHVILENFYYENLMFPPELEKIFAEQKKAEKEVLVLQQITEQEKQRKEQAEIRAQADISFLREKNDVLRQPGSNEWLYVDKWNGNLPSTYIPGSNSVIGYPIQLVNPQVPLIQQSQQHTR